MAYTSSLRAQHDRVTAMVEDIRRYYPAESVKASAADVRKILSGLAGVLRVHLAAEDGSLYPLLIASKDEAIRAMARAFMDEMGGIADAFTLYHDKWSANAIAADAEGFVAASEALFTTLTRRITRENDELYPAVDLYFEHQGAPGRA